MWLVSVIEGLIVKLKERLSVGTQSGDGGAGDGGGDGGGDSGGDGDGAVSYTHLTLPTTPYV